MMALRSSCPKQHPEGTTSSARCRPGIVNSGYRATTRLTAVPSYSWLANLKRIATTGHHKVWGSACPLRDLRLGTQLGWQFLWLFLGQPSIQQEFPTQKSEILLVGGCNQEISAILGTSLLSSGGPGLAAFNGRKISVDLYEQCIIHLLLINPKNC